MTVAIFVARDDGEFKKYGKWFAAQGIEERSEPFVCRTNSVAGKSSSLDAVLYGSRMGNLQQTQDSSVKPTRFVKNCSPSLIVVATNKATLTIKGVEAPGNIDAVGNKIIGELVGLAVDSEGEADGASGRQPLSIRTFIHWGGGDPLEFEREFANKVDAYDFSKAEQAGGWRVDDFKAFAVSSRRAGCFNVNADTIDVPDEIGKLDRIVRKFTFDEVKDCMLEYVLEYEKHGDRDSGKRLCELGSKSAIDGLRRYLSYMRSELARWSGANELIKVMLKMDVMKDGLDGGDCVVDQTKLRLDGQIAALFSYLLREGVRHG